MNKPDLDSAKNIALFVDAFYSAMLEDQQLAPIFLDVAAIDLKVHLPLICSYWEKLLLGETDYNRHTMNIHRAINAKRPLTAADFTRWLTLFTSTVDQSFAGEYAERAKRIAKRIAANMQTAVAPANISQIDSIIPPP